MTPNSVSSRPCRRRSAIAVTAYAAQPSRRPRRPRRAGLCRSMASSRARRRGSCACRHVTRAYEWGEITLASQLARAAGDARENCLEHGLRPETAAYRACINKEIEARSELLILGDDQSGVNVAEAQSNAPSAEYRWHIPHRSS